MDQLAFFEQYFSLEYYMGLEGMTTELSVTDDDEVNIEMTMATSMYSEVLEDLVGDIEEFAQGMDGLMVPNIKEMPEYQQLLTILNGLQPMQLDALYDPANPTELAFRIDLTTFMNTIAMLAGSGDMMGAPINQMTIDVVVRDGAEVTLPEQASNMNEVIDDVAKLYFVQELMMVSRNLISQAELSGDNPLHEETEVPVNVLYELAGMSSSDFEGVLDLSLSYIVNRGTMDSPEYSIYYYWSDGQAVFVEEVSLDDLEELVYTSTSIAPIIELVNDQAFDLEKLIFLIE